MSLKYKNEKYGGYIFAIHSLIVRLGMKSIVQSEPKLQIKYIDYMIV